MGSVEVNVISILAAKRTESHNDRHEKHRAIVGNCDDIGLLGEVAFGDFSGVCPDFSFDRHEGDGGVDFVIPLLYTVDVKTAEAGRNLIHRQDKPVAADIYVLADNHGDHATLVGWVWKSQFERAEVRDLGHGIPSRFISRDKLRPMSELGSRIWRVTK
jgi:hypothetical protein